MFEIPYILVVGDKEAQAASVAVRARGGVDLGVMPIDAFASRLATDVSDRRNLDLPAAPK